MNPNLKPVYAQGGERSKEQIEAEARQIMERALMHIKVYHPFFGALVSRLKLKADWRHPTSYTDAVVLGYNPEWVQKQRWENLLFVMLHETEHCALRHPFRRGSRNPKLFNDAADIVVNGALLKDPQVATYWNARDWEMPDARFDGLAVEQVYAILEHEQGAQQSPEEESEEKISGSSGEAGECLDAGASGEPMDNDEESEDGEGKSKEKGDSKGKRGKEDGGASEHRSDSQHDTDAGEPQASSDVEEPSGDREPEQRDERSSDRESEDGDGGDLDDEEHEPEEPEDADKDFDPEAEEEETADGLVVEAGDGTPSPADLSRLEHEWAEAVTTAVLAAGGDVDDAQARALGKAGEVRRSFDEYVDEFCQKCFADVESWKRPNRRFSHAYLPSMSGPSVRRIVAAVDTSGSIDDDILARFAVALERIQDAFGCEIDVVSIDSRIRNVQQFQRGEQIELVAKGGGGTSFTPAFHYFRKLEEEGIDVAGVIYLTDLEGAVDGWKKYEDITTLWVSTQEPGAGYIEPPQFGTFCTIFD
jgi:predicted metal-dependent peptidase